jgi:hypothetical protein
MTTRKRSDLPVIQDLDQAEVEWLLVREQDPGAPAPSSEIAADYAELEDLLGHLSSSASGDLWHHEVLRAISAPALPWWRTAGFRWVLGGTSIAAVAAVAVVWMLLPAPPALEVAIQQLRTTRGSPDEVVVGDRLVVTARPRELGDLRVYRSDGALIARCPNGPGCRGRSHGVQTIEITLDAPVPYRVILVDGASHASPDAAMDGYLKAARAAHARITLHPPIQVH